jgi:hypothetical protein
VREPGQARPGSMRSHPGTIPARQRISALEATARYDRPPRPGAALRPTTRHATPATPATRRDPTHPQVGASDIATHRISSASDGPTRRYSIPPPFDNARPAVPSPLPTTPPDAPSPRALPTTPLKPGRLVRRHWPILTNVVRRLKPGRCPPSPPLTARQRDAAQSLSEPRSRRHTATRTHFVTDHDDKATRALHRAARISFDSPSPGLAILRSRLRIGSTSPRMRLRYAAPDNPTAND